MRALAHREDGRGVFPRHPVVCTFNIVCLALACWFLATQNIRAVGILALTICLQNAVSLLHHWLPHSAMRQTIDHLVIAMLISATCMQFVVGLPPASGVGFQITALSVFAALVFVARIAFPAKSVLWGSLYFVSGATGFAISIESLWQLPFPGLTAFLLSAGMYTAQLIIFVVQKPDLLPQLFGFREIQHGILLGASSINLTVAAAYL